MQVGDIIKGVTSASTGATYLLTQALGAPGLFGQAFLCRRSDDNSEAVVKTLRPGRPAEDRARFLQEARSLERMAEYEQRAGLHYAVRLLDHSAPDDSETFIVIERAAGQNVLDDLIGQVGDWRHAPLDEALALEIATHLAQALHIAHQAGICYDDMKIDNLFWNAAQPSDPLRIIDWNVTSAVAERGVAGDWARFAARLYELRTGERIGVNRDGVVLGEGPAGACWQQLPEGTRDLIEQALSLRYTDDAPLLRDLRRESEQTRLDWPALLERALIADGAGQTTDVLAPAARAERLLAALPNDDPSREAALERCAILRQRAMQRRGLASTRALDYAIQSLARNEPKLAVERLQKAYAETGSRDPRPRRWLWIARLAVEQAPRYRELRDRLEPAVEALNRDDPHAARSYLSALGQDGADLPVATWLLAETDSLIAAADQHHGNGLFEQEQLRSAIEQYPDLRAMRDELQQRHAAQQRRQAALAREQELWQSASRERDQALRAEQRGEDEPAQRSTGRALAALDQILTDGCTPATEQAARALRQELHQQRERLLRQSLARQLPERARSPDPRQRAEALRLAEELQPTWAELPQLREQLRQVDACLSILERAQAAAQSATLDQALAAIDLLERAGIKVDRSGTTLRATRKQLAARRQEQHNTQAAAHAQAAARALDEARAQLNRSRCDEAQQELQSINTHDLSNALREEVEQLRAQAGQLAKLLGRVEEQRAEIERQHAAHNFSHACRLAQRLARDYPQLPRLAEESFERERELWRWLAISAGELAAAYRRLSLKTATSQQLHQLELDTNWLTSQRQAASEPIALAYAQREPLRAEADSALDDLDNAYEEWQQLRDEGVAELERSLEQAEAAAARHDNGAARRSLAELRDSYMPQDAHELGLEPIVIGVERLSSQLNQQRDRQLSQLRDLDARLNSADAQLWFEELSETFKDGPAALDPEVLKLWEHVRAQADQLQRLLARINWPDQVSSSERLDKLEAALAQLGEGARAEWQQLDRQDQQLARQDQQLQAAAEHSDQLARHQLAAIEAQHKQTLALLAAQRNMLLGSVVALCLLILVTTVIIVRLS